MRVTNDRRRKPRVRLAGAAVVHTEGTPLSCECIDLATGGVGLRSPVKVKKGRKLTVVISLGSQAITVPAVVRRCRAHRREWVLGLQFLQVDPDGTALLAAFVETALHRDVRLYQAQVFLARAGALAARTAPLPSADEDGSSPIEIDDVPASRTAAVDPGPEGARGPTGTWIPETSADLRHAVATALHDVHHELDHSDHLPPGDFGAAPPKGGTMLRRNPLLDLPASASPAFSTDVSALDFDDVRESDGRPGRGTTVVDPRVLSERTAGVRPPPLRVERQMSEAASFRPNVADLDLDDAPTRMFGDTPPSPFGGGRVRTVSPPSATSTLVGAQAPAAAPTPVPIPGHDEQRAPPATAQSGATEVAIRAPRGLPYGPVRGESTQVSIPASRPPPPSPFSEDAATRLRAHPLAGAPRGRAVAGPVDGAEGEEDTEFAARYGRALSDLDVDSR